MKSPPEEFQPDALMDALADGWDLDLTTADYAPVGAGSHHWVVTSATGAHGFATVDDLDAKPWLGETREAAFDGLGRAFRAAVALRDNGLGFVVAPIASNRGETVRRIGPRYTVALFPFVDGDAGTYGRYDATNRAAVVAMVAELHHATPSVRSIALRLNVDLPGRASLNSALRDVNSIWSAGPFSGLARRVVARQASLLADQLAAYDRLAAAMAGARDGWVVTHGEPHAANVIRTDRGHAMIDWDTVALAPPERDLWMLGDDGADELTAYTAATGHRVDHAAINFFRLRWRLADIAAFTDVLRSSHHDTGDTVAAMENLTSILAS